MEGTMQMSKYVTRPSVNNIQVMMKELVISNYPHLSEAFLGSIGDS